MFRTTSYLLAGYHSTRDISLRVDNFEFHVEGTGQRGVLALGILLLKTRELQASRVSLVVVVCWSTEYL